MMQLLGLDPPVTGADRWREWVRHNPALAGAAIDDADTTTDGMPLRQPRPGEPTDYGIINPRDPFPASPLHQDPSPLRRGRR